MIPDSLEREQALDPSQSFIVQAPAGSGKTELLTQRFLRLLATVQEPEEILAITFTKKAAAEMRARLNAALSKAEHAPPPESPHEYRRWLLAKEALAQSQRRNWGLLANPNRLRIKTIDAFNSLLTRQLPLLSHFGAPPEIVEYPQELYREAVQTFLTHLEEKVEWSQAIADLLLHLDTNMKQAEELLIEMLGKRDQWLPYIIAHQSQPALRSVLEKNLASVITETLSALRAAFPAEEVPELQKLVRFALGQLKSTNSTSSLFHCQHLEGLPGTTPADLPAWRGLADLLLTAEHSFRKRIDSKLGFPPEAREQKKSLLELLETLRQQEKLEALFSELYYLPNAHYTEKQWDILKALHEVLTIVVAQLNLSFKQQGKIDYTENAQAALLALGSEEAPTDLALVLDYQIKHLLVDEFQDTSHTQFRLLEKLVLGWQPEDGRTLFLVGDPMQSIYRFREAEVGLFIRAREQGLGSLSLKPLTLSLNFRSSAPLVQWINKHFASVMPAFDELTSGAVSYTPSIAQRDSQTSEEAVQLHAFADGLAHTQAEKIVEIVQQTFEQKPEDTIAILVRSRSHLRSLIPVFKKAGLVYQAIDIDPLETRPLIQDLLALTRALLYPLDRIAWLALLRAPWCGLNLSDLLILAGDSSQDLLWQRLQEPSVLNALSTEGQQRLARILPALKAAIDERYREELASWVEKTWIFLGGPACVDNEAELKDATLFFGLLKKLSLGGTAPGSGLKWNLLQETIKKLYAQSLSSSRLQIMTIHNAKGLEFDTVILPQLEKGTVAANKPLLTWLERPGLDQATRLLLAPLHATEDEIDETYTHIRHQDKLKSKHENGRLLYVAATRAKKALHLLFSLKTTRQAEITSPADNSLLKKLWPSLQAQLSFSSTAPSRLSHPHQKQEGLQRLTLSWKNFLSPERQPRPLHNKIQGFRLAESKAQAIGIIIHRLLQEIGHYGLPWWQNSSNLQQQQYIQLLIFQQDIPAAFKQEAAATIAKALQLMLQDPRGRWILEQTQAEAELALTTIINGKPQLLVIDRTFVDSDNRRWIIDYKTSVPHQEDLASFLEQEKEKYAKQLYGYQQALEKLDNRAICLGLYFPLVPAWTELSTCPLVTPA